jgi:hypothetical protein
VLNGMQSHCGTLASNRRLSSRCDVASKFLLATRIFCTGCCARFLGDETCCSSKRLTYSIQTRVGRQVFFAEFFFRFF